MDLSHEEWAEYVSAGVNYADCSELIKSVQFWCSIPVHNLNFECVLSPTQSQSTNEGNRLSVESKRMTVIVYHNFEDLSREEL